MSDLFFQLKSHAFLFEDEQIHDEEPATMEIRTAIVSLVAVTVVTSFVADILVGAIDEFAATFDLSKAFIGLILLPIVGNAAEHATSVVMAYKGALLSLSTHCHPLGVKCIDEYFNDDNDVGKMELTIGVAVGSSIQIAVGVIPLVVMAGWVIDQPLTLFFGSFETIVLFISCLLVHLLVQDGKSNYLEGLMLIALYLIIALSFYVS